MPPDTTHKPGITDTLSKSIDFFQHPADTFLSGQGLQQHLDSLEARYLKEQKEKGPKYLIPEGIMFVMVLGILLISIYLYIVRPANREKKKRITKYRLPGREESVREFTYAEWLETHNKYFAALSEENKKRFIYRTKRFLESKEFRFHQIKDDEFFSVLISSAAVQITFGLTDYLVNYFPVIHIIKKEYTLKKTNITYAGHVSKNGIYISWSHFLKGYKDYKDGLNTALHEMAHAISFNYVFGRYKNDPRLASRLANYLSEREKALKLMQRGYYDFLGTYALENPDEFWAVCIEHFFENSEHFRENAPALYNSIAILLNQDPLSKELILDQSLAGIANEEN